MRDLLRMICFCLTFAAAALAWAGLVCLNSGEPDFTEQFWFYGLVLFIVGHLAMVASTLSVFDDRDEEEAR